MTPTLSLCVPRGLVGRSNKSLPQPVACSASDFDGLYGGVWAEPIYQLRELQLLHLLHRAVRAISVSAIRINGLLIPLEIPKRLYAGGLDHGPASGGVSGESNG